MKITSLRTLCLSRAHEPERQWFTAGYRCVKADCAIVVVETDEGLQGIGEACAYGTPPKIRGEVERLAPSLLGRDPLDPEVNPRPVGINVPLDTAVAGIDAALWDLRGKATGRRVADLLAAPGQPPVNRVPLYASSGCRYDWDHQPESVVEEAVSYADQGYTAYKMRLGTDWARSGVTVAHFIALFEKVMAAVGDRMEVMVDGNQRLGLEEALVMARELEALGCAFLEEPIPQADIAGYARLNASVSMPITGGEQLTTVAQFEPYLEQRAYAIVQADGGWCGLSEGMRIARRAWEYGVGMCPHNWHNGLMTLANAHLVAALPQPKMLELCMIQGPLQWGILKEMPRIEGGYLELPAAPGLGAQLADDLEARFPYLEGPYGVRVE